MKHGVRKALAGFAVMAAVAAFGACGNDKDSSASDDAPTTTTSTTAVTGGDVMLTSADNNASKTITVGQKLVVELDVNGGTGYTWKTSTEPDAKILKQVSQTQHKQAGSSDSADGAPMVGTPETVTTTFEAVAPGTTKVVLSLVGPGEGRKAEDTFTVTVTVAAAQP